MPKQISEAQFEEHIQDALIAQHGYTKRGASSYDMIRDGKKYKVQILEEID